MNSYVIFECEDCNNIKIIESKGFMTKLKCTCDNPITRLYSLFKDGKVCRIQLKGVSRI
jgi:hypothetical protein